MREKILFDDNWIFHRGDIEEFIPPRKGPIYTSAKTERMIWGPASIKHIDNSDLYDRTKEANNEFWETVHLPHDYIISGEVKKENNNALGFFTYENAWYRKHFNIPAEDEGRRLTLVFDGVATRATVYLNGCELKHNFCGYTTFEVDITDYVKYGEENVLAVYTAYHKNEGWWYQGGGIYRHVWLVKTEDVSVDLWGVFVHAKKENGLWNTVIETEIRNDSYENRQVKAVSTFIDKNGNELFSASNDITVGLRSKATVKYGSNVDVPFVWDAETPENIYKVRTDLYVDGKLTDTVFDRFGFRDFEFTKDGFFLNGRKVFINGLCGHGDFGLTGKAVPDNILRYKVKLMKEMGANGYRSSHYPQANATLDALDDYGFIVMDEARWFDSTDDGIDQLTMLIKRDRNHPSVFMWSLGNEEPHHLTETGRKIYKSMMTVAKRLDPTRPTTSAVSNDPSKATVYDDMDVVGINYNHRLYDIVREKYPEKPIYASECCASSTTRGWYEDDDPVHGYISSYDHDCTSWFIGREKFMEVISARPWVCGLYQWIAFEHRGEAVWPRLCSQAGAIDLFLQKKDAFYQNQSLFMTTPMIHLLPHWNWMHKLGEEIRVVVYTTCEECELFLNGESLGRRTCERFKHLEWNVQFAPGELKVIGYVGGKEAVCDVQRTTKRPAKLMLRCENPDGLVADSESIALFTCYCVDEDGLEVPDAHPTVSFFTNGLGQIAGTGSDISDHTPVTVTVRKMRAGKISVAVKTTDVAGKLFLFAESECFDTAKATVDIKKY